MARNEVKKRRAQAIADSSGWTVAALEDAGLRKIEVLCGISVANAVIESDDRVILGQLGGYYLVGELR